jgi:hypothetical protein
MRKCVEFARRLAEERAHEVRLGRWTKRAILQDVDSGLERFDARTTRRGEVEVDEGIAITAQHPTRVELLRAN